MRIRNWMTLTALVAGVLLFSAAPSQAQVIGGTRIDPFTGRIVTNTTGYNPLTNQVGSSSIVTNPFTGAQTGVAISQNPWTGTIYRTDIARNPWTGGTVTYQQQYNPLFNQYRWRAGVRPW